MMRITLITIAALAGYLAPPIIQGVAPGFMPGLVEFNEWGSNTYIAFLIYSVVPLVGFSIFCAVSANRGPKAWQLVSRAVLIYGATTIIASFVGICAGVFWYDQATFQDLLQPTAVEATTGWRAWVAWALDIFLTPAWKKVDVVKLVVVLLVFTSVVYRRRPELAEKMNIGFTAAQEICVEYMESLLKLLPIAMFMVMFNLRHEYGGNLLEGPVGYFFQAGMTAVALHYVITWMLTLFRFGSKRTLGFFRCSLSPVATAMASRSSMATLPVTIEAAQKAGVGEDVSEFVPAFGGTINMDGTSAALSAGAVIFFSAQGHDIGLGIAAAIVLAVMLTSAGTAAAPSASLALFGTLLMTVGNLVGIKVEESQTTQMVVLLAAVDPVMDMFRTALNVDGDFKAAIWVQEWIGPQTEEGESS